MSSGQRVSGQESSAHSVREQTRRHVAGLAVVPATIETALDALWADVASGRVRTYALVNGYSATLRRESSEYAAMLQSERVVPLPDGIPLALGAWLTGQGGIGRCPGPDLLEAAAARAAADGTTFYLLGGNLGVVERLRDALLDRHPGLMVVGVSTPPFGDWDESASRVMCDDIRRTRADIIWLGVSAPKQETWSLSHLDAIEHPVVCVGAAFDFLSGAKLRAPKWVRTMGMEWLFRLLSEPRRLWRRYLVGNAVFLVDLARYRGRFVTSAERRR